MSETIFLLVSHQSSVVSDQISRYTPGNVEVMMRRDNVSIFLLVSHQITVISDQSAREM